MVRAAPQPDTLPAPANAAAPGLSPAVFDALPWALLGISRTLKISYANAAAAELFDLGLRALLGRRLADLWGEDSVALSLIMRALSGGAAVTEESIQLARQDGSVLRASFDAIPLDAATENGDIALLVALRDRTLAERLDRQAAHRDGARSFGALAAMLAHEIRNPLSGIRGAAQLLAPPAGSGESTLSDLICQEVDRIVGVLDTVEILASGQPFERSEQNIHEILDYVCTAASAGFARERRIVREYDPSLPPIAGDRGRLVQAFLNLVKNAAEATETVGGEIRIVTRYDPGLSQIGADGTRKRIPVVVSITDDGPGIPDTIREHLFDPFMTTKPQGRGLGLALVARIVADHDGAIDVTSEPRRTRFDIMLPVAGPAGR